MNPNVDLIKIKYLLQLQHCIEREARNGDVEYLDRAIEQILSIKEGTYPVYDKFARFRPLLRPLDRQIVELRRVNHMMPESMRAPDSWFVDLLHTTSTHIQRVDDLEFFFIISSKYLKEVLEYQIKLIKLTQPHIHHSGFATSEGQMCFNELADMKLYKKPGIYRLRINLVDNWFPKTGITVNYVRELSRYNNITLSGLPAIGAYAAQCPELYQSQDGENLPSFSLAEIQQGEDFGDVVYSAWDDDDKCIYFYSAKPTIVCNEFATPTLIHE